MFNFLRIYENLLLNLTPDTLFLKAQKIKINGITLNNTGVFTPYFNRITVTDDDVVGVADDVSTPNGESAIKTNNDLPCQPEYSISSSRRRTDHSQTLDYAKNLKVYSPYFA
ncbi:MAG: hypothetical protein IPN36_14720 [Bacteroidetes bacterium]|nr:hypothetical protein [Bacteroidota bacterium]